MVLVLLVILLVLAVGGLPQAGPLIPHGYGYGPSSVLLVVLVVLVVLILMGRV